MVEDSQANPTDPADMLVVDFATRVGSWTYVTGWAGPRVSGIGAGPGHDCIVQRHDRPDVSEVYGLRTGQGLGFVAAIPAPAGDLAGDLALGWVSPASASPQQTPLEIRETWSDQDLNSLMPMIERQARDLPRGSADWVSHAVLLSDAMAGSTRTRGHVDRILQHETQGYAVSGWAIGRENTEFFLMDAAQTVVPLTGMDRLDRPDLLSIEGVSPNQAARAGFVAHIRQDLVAPIQFIAATGDTVLLLSRKPIQPEPLPADPKEAARALFAMHTPIQSFHDRVERIDWKFLAPLIAAGQARWEACEIEEREFGPQPEAPEVSVIVPLYGRHDFVEHQLMEFCRDPYMRERAEIVYVVDDPAIVISSGSELAELYGLYRQPFRWIWGGVNRGFSGANNLGAARARADRLLFMNSDVFPTAPGWLARMVEALDSHPKLGVVTPQLRFAGGGIQHAGMVSRRLDSIGVWINHHPHMGFDPALDPRKALDAVPIATGACMLLRRAEFEELGGWDTGYLIGDFEDSDLCYKYRSRDLDIGYLPTVSLVHLERQSFAGIGTDDFKTRVMIANSVRHSGRWPQFLHAD